MSIPIEQIERTGEHDARLLIRIDSLAGADQSVRLAGAVCGAEFDLDVASRQALGLFHARFLEERAHGTQRLASGGEHAVDASHADAQRAPAAPGAEALR